MHDRCLYLECCRLPRLNQYDHREAMAAKLATLEM